MKNRYQNMVWSWFCRARSAFHKTVWKLWLVKKIWTHVCFKMVSATCLGYCRRTEYCNKFKGQRYWLNSVFHFKCGWHFPSVPKALARQAINFHISRCASHLRHWNSFTKKNFDYRDGAVDLLALPPLSPPKVNVENLFLDPWVAVCFFNIDFGGRRGGRKLL